jgi:hypothetical protein
MSPLIGAQCATAIELAVLDCSASDLAWHHRDGKCRSIDRPYAHDALHRLDGVLHPAQVDTCTEALLRDSAAAARERRLPLQIPAQSVVEFHEIMRRHGRTPIEWLREIGVLGFLHQRRARHRGQVRSGLSPAGNRIRTVGTA